MSYLLRNSLEISLFFNDIEYPLQAINILNYLHITALVKGAVPLLSVQISDVDRSFDRMGLKDGIPIRVVIKAQNNRSKTYSFRSFNINKIPIGGNFVYTITGYWDSPKYWIETTSDPIRATSDSTLSQIAAKCGLGYDGTPSSDSQLWVPQNKIYRNWARDVASKGYVDDGSCMRLALDLDGTLRYKNVNNLSGPETNIVAYQYQPNCITAADYTTNADNGFNNSLTGYQNARYKQSSVSAETYEELKDLLFKPDVKAPLYNTELKARISRGAVRFGPIDVGNVHPNYEKASYQNLRYSNLFNFGLTVLTMMQTDIKLLSKVNFSVQKEDTSVDTFTSGVYTISGKAVYIEGSTYSERLALTRHGVNQ